MSPKDFENLRTEIRSIRENVLVTKEHVEYLRKHLEGNGKKGIIQQVQDNTYWRYAMTGAITLLSSLVGWGLMFK